MHEARGRWSVGVILGAFLLTGRGDATRRLTLEERAAEAAMEQLRSWSARWDPFARYTPLGTPLDLDDPETLRRVLECLRGDGR